MMGVYLGSALTMANSGVSDLVVSFSIFGIVATVNFLASSLGWQSLEKDLSQNEGVKALAEWDSVKGLAVLFFNNSAFGPDAVYLFVVVLCAGGN